MKLWQIIITSEDNRLNINCNNNTGKEEFLTPNKGHCCTIFLSYEPFHCCTTFFQQMICLSIAAHPPVMQVAYNSRKNVSGWQTDMDAVFTRLGNRILSCAFGPRKTT